MNGDEDTEPQHFAQVERLAVKGLRERRSFIVLVLISVFLSIAVFVAGQVTQTENEHKFCDIMTFSLAGPVPQKPADPKAHPSRERAYEGYQKFIRLGHALGCY